MKCPACGGNGKADGVGDLHDIYGSDNCGMCGGSGRVPETCYECEKPIIKSDGFVRERGRIYHPRCLAALRDKDSGTGGNNQKEMDA